MASAPVTPPPPLETTPAGVRAARRGWWLIPLRTLGLALVVGFLAGGLAKMAPQWLDPLQQRPFPPHVVTADDRCPVCGMYPARFAKWRAQAVFHDQGYAAFDSAASLFRYLGRIERYTPARRREDVADLYLTDYDSGAWLPGETALVVLGSSLAGPMGDPGLPAFASQEAAERFAAARGGQVLPFSQVLAAPELQGRITAGR